MKYKLSFLFALFFILMAGLIYAFPPVEVHNPARTDSPYMWDYQNLLMADGVNNSVTLSGVTASDSTGYYWLYPTTAIAFTVPSTADSVAFWIFAETCHISTGATAAVTVSKIDSLYIDSTGRKTWRIPAPAFDEYVRFRFAGATGNGKDKTVLNDMRINRSFKWSPIVSGIDSNMVKSMGLSISNIANGGNGFVTKPALDDTISAVELRRNQAISDSLFLALLKTAFPDSADAWYARTLSIMRTAAFRDSFIVAWNDSIAAATLRHKQTVSDSLLLALLKSSSADSVDAALARADSSKIGDGKLAIADVNQLSTRLGEKLEKTASSDSVAAALARGVEMLKVLNNTTSTNNLLELVKNGVAKVVVDTTGNVGIGTTSPDAKLTVRSGSINLTGSGSETPHIKFSKYGSTAGLDMWSDFGSGNSYIDNKFDSATGLTYFRTRTGGTPVNAMVIQSSGNVGIGTTTPIAKLSVVSATVDTNKYIERKLKGETVVSDLDTLGNATYAGALTASSVTVDPFLWEIKSVHMYTVASDSATVTDYIDTTATNVDSWFYKRALGNGSDSWKNSIVLATQVPLPLKTTPDSLMFRMRSNAVTDSATIQVIVKNHLGTILLNTGQVAVSTVNTWEYKNFGSITAMAENKPIAVQAIIRTKYDAFMDVSSIYFK